MKHTDKMIKLNGDHQWIRIFIFLALTLLRVLVGFHPHSGQNNHHGKLDAYGGDYEAQRHWMELTLHVPIGKWYYYDLEYWGLDYPPLTAYISYLCGLGSSFLVGPETVALELSRGYEDPTHKAYMRATVLFFDVLVYFTAVWILSERLVLPSHSSTENGKHWILLLALAQPSLILIDHGHFQYNTVSLGLALWSFYFITKSKSPHSHGTSNDFTNCIWGSVFFCLALNFKQMVLYYSPAVFAYLLGRCYSTKKSKVSSDSSNDSLISKSSRPKFMLSRFCLLGVTVILTFGALWWPFIVYRRSEDTMIDSLKQILHRLFPFQRGLFEGKVANLWCALSMKPVSIRQRLPSSIQPLLALALTLVMIAPFCMKLFILGKNWETSIHIKNEWCESVIQKSTNSGTGKSKEIVYSNNDHHLKYFLWGVGGSALAFFLASFQVHEKSILIPLTPISMLLYESPMFVLWFSFVAVWTMWPLLSVDQLTLPYISVSIIFATIAYVYIQSINDSRENKTLPLYKISFLFMIVLHIMEILVHPPENLPDIFPLLFSVVGCVLFSFSWMVSCWKIWFTSSHLDRRKDNLKTD